jgi:hypothetical protein
MTGRLMGLLIGIGFPNFTLNQRKNTAALDWRHPIAPPVYGR